MSRPVWQKRTDSMRVKIFMLLLLAAGGAAFAAESIPALEFSFESPLIKPYWDRDVAKVEAGPEEAPLIREAEADAAAAAPDKNVKLRAIYRTKDEALTYFDLSSDSAADYVLVYIYSNAEKRFLGRFPGSRA